MIVIEQRVDWGNSSSKQPVRFVLASRLRTSYLFRVADERRQQREDTIRDLESKPYRNPEEEDRLGRLRLDSEFEKRAEQARKDNERDSDDERDSVKCYKIYIYVFVLYVRFHASVQYRCLLLLNMVELKCGLSKKMLLDIICPVFFV